MKKYDMTPIEYLEPTFLPIARNNVSYICPVCNSGSGKKGTGMTSRDGIHWKCWSCGLSANKVELYQKLHSLNYEDACIGLLRFYGIDPISIGEKETAAVWLSQDEMEALALSRNSIQLVMPDGTIKFTNICELYNDDPQMYYGLILNRANEMLKKYQTIQSACGKRSSGQARLVYDLMGKSFDEAAYQKLGVELKRRTDCCNKLIAIYSKRIHDTLPS